jgi:hypothetical protein
MELPTPIVERLSGKLIITRCPVDVAVATSPQILFIPRSALTRWMIDEKTLRSAIRKPTNHNRPKVAKRDLELHFSFLRLPWGRAHSTRHDPTTDVRVSETP